MRPVERFEFLLRRRKMSKSIVLTALFSVALFLVAPLGVLAQSPDDPEIVKAKEETAIVYDLARFFGFMNTMEQENPKLALSNDQVKAVYALMQEIQGMERIEPDAAEEFLVYLEDEVLTPEQLMEVDQLIIAREQSRDTSTANTGSGDGGLITSYLQGGAFNPMTTTGRKMGDDFLAYLEIVRKRL